MKVLYWRILAIILLLVWILAAFTYNFLAKAMNTDILISNNIVYIVLIALSTVLIVFPKKFFLYAIMCYALGLVDIFDGVGTNAFIIYALGYCFHYKAGRVFRKKSITVIVLLLPLFFILLQYRLGPSILTTSLMELLFLIVVLSLFLLLNKNLVIEIYRRMERKQSEKINLETLNTEELTVVKDVLNGKTFSAIGLEIYKSESAVKQTMVKVYAKLNIENKKELLELDKKNLLVFPK
ncbi:MAG: hypothetical protein R3Y36_03815 [Spirochaetales bacterium]